MRKIIEGLKEPLKSSATEEMAQLSAATVRGMAYAFSGANNGALKARVLADAGRRPEALAAYQAALRDQKDSDAIQLLHDAIQVLQWELDFAGGKSIVLKADPHLTGFAPGAGQWQSDPDGGFTGTAGASESLSLACPADFGDAWELTAEIEFGNQRAEWDLVGIRLATPGTSQNMTDITLCRSIPSSVPTKQGKVCIRTVAGEPATTFPPTSGKDPIP